MYFAPSLSPLRISFLVSVCDNHSLVSIRHEIDTATFFEAVWVNEVPYRRIERWTYFRIRPVISSITGNSVTLEMPPAYEALKVLGVNSKRASYD